MSFCPPICVVIFITLTVIIVINIITVRCLERCFPSVVVLVLLCGAGVVVRVFVRSLVSCDCYSERHQRHSEPCLKWDFYQFDGNAVILGAYGLAQVRIRTPSVLWKIVALQERLWRRRLLNTRKL